MKSPRGQVLQSHKCAIARPDPIAVLLLLALRPAAQGVEAWYLPYQPDAACLVLAHFEDDAVLGSGGGGLVVEGERVDGRFGQGVRLDGQRQKVTVRDCSALRFGRQEPFTIEVWVRPADRRGGALWSCATRWYLHVGADAQFGYRSESFPIRYQALSDLGLRPGRWSHVALSHDEQRVVRVHVDGELRGEVRHEDEGDFARGGAILSLGAHDGWTKYLAADLDELRVSRGARRYHPLLAQRHLLAGERLRLGSSAAELPDRVAAVALAWRGRPQPVVVPRDRLDAGLVGVEELPDGAVPLALSFLDAAGQTIGAAEATVTVATALVEDAGRRLTALQQVLPAAAGPWREVLSSWLADLTERLRERRLDELDQRLAAAERVAAMTTSGEAAWRARLHQRVRSKPLPDRVRVTLSWSGAADGAYPWADRLGANELVAHGGEAQAETLRAWRQRGYHTVALASVPIHDTAWLRDHPDHRQRGFWVSKTVTATSPEVAIQVTPPSWSHYSLETADAQRWWRVKDGHDAVIPPDRWTLDAKSRTVTIHGATPGESYRVYYTFRAEQFLDPLAPGSLERGMAHLAETLAPLRGVLETFWFDDLSYGYPGASELGPWDWESYTLAAGPAQVAAFEQDTGIAFDPQWLVLTPRTIDAVPDPRYLAWMRWVRDRLKPWLAANGQVVKDAGMRSWLYWGDCHVGMEPYGGSLAALDELDKPAGDPVTVRALTDFPGAVTRRMRTDWIYSYTATQPRMGRHHRDRWLAARRGLLANPTVTGLYWVTFESLAGAAGSAVADDVIETIADVSDEFRLLNLELAGAEPFRHELDLVVLHAWGDNYAWRPWGSPILWHLTDLPVRIRFLSFAEVQRDGLPAETDALLLYGLPDTAWSGGTWWRDGKVAAAVQALVARGGGVVALQAPSALDGAWRLSDLLGVRPVGEQAAATTTIEPAELADVAGGEAEAATAGAALQVIRTGRNHPLWRGLPTRLAGLTDTVRVAADADVVAALDDGQGHLTPGLVARQVGRGRVVWLAGYARGDDFSRLLRHALFWAAGREADEVRLEVDGDGLFVYAYPSRRLLVVHNDQAQTRSATVRCDPAIVGLSAATLTLTELVTGETRTVTVADLRAGTPLPVAPHAMALWRVE